MEAIPADESHLLPHRRHSLRRRRWLLRSRQRQRIERGHRTVWVPHGCLFALFFRGLNKTAFFFRNAWLLHTLTDGSLIHKKLAKMDLAGDSSKIYLLDLVSFGSESDGLGSCDLVVPDPGVYNHSLPVGTVTILYVDGSVVTRKACDVNVVGRS